MCAGQLSLTLQEASLLFLAAGAQQASTHVGAGCARPAGQADEGPCRDQGVRAATAAGAAGAAQQVAGGGGRVHTHQAASGAGQGAGVHNLRRVRRRCGDGEDELVSGHWQRASLSAGRLAMKR